MYIYEGVVVVGHTQTNYEYSSSGVIELRYSYYCFCLEFILVPHSDNEPTRDLRPGLQDICLNGFSLHHEQRGGKGVSTVVCHLVLL